MAFGDREEYQRAVASRLIQRRNADVQRAGEVRFIAGPRQFNGSLGQLRGFGDGTLRLARVAADETISATHDHFRRIDLIAAAAKGVAALAIRGNSRRKGIGPAVTIPI